MAKKTTVSQELYQMVAKHGLHEIADRLVCIISEQLNVNPDDALHDCLLHAELLRKSACELELDFK